MKVKVTLEETSKVFPLRQINAYPLNVGTELTIRLPNGEEKNFYVSKIKVKGSNWTNTAAKVNKRVKKDRDLLKERVRKVKGKRRAKRSPKKGTNNASK